MPDWRCMDNKNDRCKGNLQWSLIRNLIYKNDWMWFMRRFVREKKKKLNAFSLLWEICGDLLQARNSREGKKIIRKTLFNWLEKAISELERSTTNYQYEMKVNISEKFLKIIGMHEKIHFRNYLIHWCQLDLQMI